MSKNINIAIRLIEEELHRCGFTTEYHRQGEYDKQRGREDIFIYKNEVLTGCVWESPGDGVTCCVCIMGNENCCDRVIDRYDFDICNPNGDKITDEIIARLVANPEIHVKSCPGWKK